MLNSTGVDPLIHDLPEITPPARPFAPPISRSRAQCRARGQRPEVWDRPTVMALPGEGVLTALRPALEDMVEFVEGTYSAALLVNDSLAVVEVLGNHAMLARLERLGLRRGAAWAEERIGTNAVALALHEGHPLATVGQDHFSIALHEFAIAAAPLFGPAGQPIGGIAIVTAATGYHPFVLATVAAAAQGIQTRLQLEGLIAEANAHLTELNVAIETVSDGLLLISADDRIARLNGRVEQILGIAARSAAGRPLRDVLPLPSRLDRALRDRETLAEQEFVWTLPHGTFAIVGSLRPMIQHGSYLGALLTLHAPERVRDLVQQVVGSDARVAFSDVLGESPAIQIAIGQARIAANSAVNVLLLGEDGTGKDVLARAIHHASRRASGPFVMLDCATAPRSLIGVELFGSESSSDDRRRGRPGKLELAQGGTLLLRTVEALPMEYQTALLRALDARSLFRLGGRRVVPLDVRVIATSASGLDVGAGRFRPDLAARLSGITIELPPLRVRGDDLLLFINHLLAALNARLGKQIVFSPDALEAMLAYPWPGNIRELEAVLEQIAHTTEQSVIALHELPPPISQWTLLDNPAGSLQKHHDHVEREAILRAGRAVGGNLNRTAQQLGISRTTLWRKMRDHGLSRSDLWQLG